MLREPLKLYNHSYIRNGIQGHSFCINNKYYFYDPINADIYSIGKLENELLFAATKETYEERKRLIDDVESNYGRNKVYSRLEQLFNTLFNISSNQNIIPARIKNIEPPVLGSFKHLILEISQACNFRCDYCPRTGKIYQYFTPHSNKMMSKRLALRCIEYFLDTTKYKEPWISFYGGEPLLQHELIIECMKYAKIKNSNVKFALQTNGSLINDKIIRILAEYDVQLGISLDGPRSIHDKYRKTIAGEGTYDKVYKNIVRAFEINKDYMRNKCQILSTLTSILKIREISKFFNNDKIISQFRLKINNIKIAFIIREAEILSELYNKDENRKEQHLNRIISEYVAVSSDRAWIKRKYEHALFRRELEGVHIREPLASSEYKLRHLCPLGGWKLYFNVEGEFRICEKSTNLPIIGSIYRGINWSKVKEMNDRFLEDSQSCNKCWALSMCDLCWIHTYNNGKISSEIKKTFCKEKKSKVEKAIDIYYRISKINMAALKVFDIGSI